VFAVVGDAQGALKLDLRLGVFVNLGETKNQAVAFECDHVLAF
jgi:hypothetical protein